jgi:hypothetical protein
LAHLTDMEELLATIPRVYIRDYMREAMRCYMADAYRGCVVLSYIALFDDLLAKLGELASVNGAAKAIFTDATKKKTDQDVYESFLIDQLSAKGFISGLDASFLTTLRTLRNKSAHPSGHHPSPEEARFIFYECISRFLSKPVLSTTHAVDELLQRLKNANFFPAAVMPDIKSVVSDELGSLHPEVIPQLVARLSPLIGAADKTADRNAALFLLGLASQSLPAASSAIQQKVVEAKADDAAFADIIIQMLSVDGKLVVGLKTTTVARIRAIVTAKVEEVTSALSESKLIHPTQVLTSISGALPEADFVTTFKPELEALFQKRAHSEFVVRLVSSKPSLLPLYFPALLTRAGSYTFDVANAVANAMESLDKPISEILGDEQAFELLVAITKAAEWGAYAAKGIVSARFGGTPLLRAKALAHTGAAKKKALEHVEAKLTWTKSIEDFVASHFVPEETAET